MQEIAIVVLIIVIAVGVGVYFYMRRRSEGLRDKFGDEYDRVVTESDSRLDAESELRQREKRVDQLEIRPLDPDSRRRYEERWTELERRFVDDPAATVGEADRMVIEVMRERSYPIDNFEQRAADLSVDHPDVVENYRLAHDIAVRHEQGHADTEDLRQAVVYYRALVEDLLRDDEQTFSENQEQP